MNFILNVKFENNKKKYGKIITLNPVFIYQLLTKIMGY